MDGPTGRTWRNIFGWLTRRRRGNEVAGEETLGRYRAAWDASLEGMRLTDQNGQVVQVNEAYCRMVGLSRQQLEGQPFSIIFREDLRAHVLAAYLRRVGEEQIESHLSRELRLWDGRRVFVDVSVVKLGRQEEFLVLSVFRDVTAQRRSEMALLGSEERYRVLFENSSDALLTIAIEDGRITSANSRAVKLFAGSEVEDLCGLGPWDLSPAVQPDGRESKEKAMALMGQLRWQPAMSFEWRHRRRTGEEFSTAVWLSRLEVGGQSLVLASIHDVTLELQAMNRLRESESLQRQLMESVSAGVLIVDARTHVIERMNPAAAEMLGWNRDEAVGQVCDRLVCPGMPGNCPLPRPGAEIEQVDHSLLRADGRVLTVMKSIKRIQIGGEEKLLETFIDITARKEAEEALKETNRQLAAATERANEMAGRAAEANQAKSDFLANMSHEIRTPMNGVIGMLGLLLDSELNADQRRYAELAQSSAESLLRLINDILDFSKIEARKLTLETVAFDLEALLNEFASTMAMRAEEKGLELICALQPGTPSLMLGDPGRLRQVLTNLVGNAVKFTDRGHVVVRAWKEEETPREFVMGFSVRDTGLGIPHEKLGLLFEKFSQVDASSTRKHGGTGLGLAISKQLVEMMGGSIQVSSEPGSWAEFRFTARFVRGCVELQQAPAKSLRGVRALVVDGNEVSRELLLELLEYHGMVAEGAGGEEEALVLLAQAEERGEQYRVVVANEELVAVSIRRQARYNGVALLVMRSMSRPAAGTWKPGVGWQTTLRKPLRPAELIESLLRAVDGRPAEEAQQPAKGELPRRDARVLLAEDNITNQQVALGVLRKYGLRVDAVANGLEAVQALESLPYDMVLMDVQMPEMDGLEATRLIRGQHSNVLNRDIPIIAMTAHAMQATQQMCLEAGMNGYISKPVNPEAMLELLDRWIPARAQEKVAMTEREMVFDHEGLMERLAGDRELAASVLECFWEDFPLQMVELRRAVEQSDTKGAQLVSHSIKGAAASIGGNALMVVARDCEGAARAGNLAALGVLLPDLESHFRELKAAVADW